MKAPIPARASQRLLQRLSRMAEQLTDRSGPGPTAVASIEREAIDLMRAEPVMAHYALGILAVMCFDTERALERARILDNLGERRRAETVRLHSVLWNMQATQALPIIGRLLRDPGELDMMPLVEFAVCAGALQAAAQAIDEAKTSRAMRLGTQFLTARAGAQALASLQEDDAALARVLDAAGEVLREHGLLWLGSAPQIVAMQDEDGQGPGLSYLYRVQASPEQAARMNWELAGLLAQRDINPHISASFVGVAA